MCSMALPVLSKAQHEEPLRTSAATNKTKSRRKFDQGKQFLWINAQIIANSQENCSVDSLALTISNHLHNMNLVNLTTSIHRLAKMVAHDAKAQALLKQSQILPKLLPPIAKMLSTTDSSSIQSQSLCNIVWSLASIRIADTQIISLVCKHTIPNINNFKPFELTLLLWALAKLSSMECSLSHGEVQMSIIFEHASKYIIQRARSMQCRCLSMVVWAYATARQFDTELFAAVAKEIVHGPTPTCQEMANTIWAYGTQGIMNHDLFVAFASKGVKNIADFKAQELSNMLWGFASSGFFHDMFFQCAAFAALSKELSTQHLANILWAFTRVRPRYPLTQRIVLSFLPLCHQQLCKFKAQEVSSVALTVAKAFSHSELIPSEVLSFFAAVSKARYNVADFSTQSLTNMSSAFAMMKIYEDPILLQLGNETVARAPFMEPPDLFRVFQVYLSAQGASTGCAHIAGLLVSPLADRLKSLRPRDIKILTNSCTDFLRDANRHDLLEHCAQIVDNVSVSVESHQHVDTKFAGDLNLEVASGAETEEPRNSISDLSDSGEVDSNSDRIASDAEQNSNQQLPYVYGSVGASPSQDLYNKFDCLANPYQQWFHISGFDWSQQQLMWGNEQLFNVPCGQWNPTTQIAYVENVEGQATTYNTKPHPSSLLWDVGDSSNVPPSKAALVNNGTSVIDRAFDEGSSSVAEKLRTKVLVGDQRVEKSSFKMQSNKESKNILQACLDRLEQHSTDSISKVVVKNTFIECRNSDLSGISAVHFCSEKVHTRRSSKDPTRSSKSRLYEIPLPDDAYDTDDGF